MLCWIASYPRSGNGFLRHVLETLTGLQTFTQYTNEPDSVGCLPLSALHTDTCPVYFCKTHNNRSDFAAKFPAVHIVRDGRDALCSQAEFELTLGYYSLHDIGYEEILDRLIDGTSSGFSWQSSGWSWSEHTASWLGHDNVHTIRFDELIADPVGQAVRAIDRFELRVTVNHHNKIKTFSELQAEHPQLYRRGESGLWRSLMTDEQQDRFWKYHGGMMAEFGYQREHRKAIA